jgi:hypothetical protein
MVIVMATLAGLLTIAAVTLLQVGRGIKASTQDSMRSGVIFAAESGASAGMDFLRLNANPVTFFSAFVSASNGAPQSPAGIAGNGILSGQTGNLFSPDTKLWFEVTILNNADDTSFAAGSDADAIVILRSVGHGPGGTQVTLDVEVKWQVGLPLSLTGWRQLE